MKRVNPLDLRAAAGADEAIEVGKKTGEVIAAGGVGERMAENAGIDRGVVQNAATAATGEAEGNAAIGEAEASNERSPNRRVARKISPEPNVHRRSRSRTIRLGSVSMMKSKRRKRPKRMSRRLRSLVPKGMRPARDGGVAGEENRATRARRRKFRGVGMTSARRTPARSQWSRRNRATTLDPD